MSTPSDTPETDSEEAKMLALYEKHRAVDWPPFDGEPYHFARKLERDRDEAMELAELRRNTQDEYGKRAEQKLIENGQLHARVVELEKVLLVAEDELGQTNEHLINRIAEGELVTIWQSDVEKTLELIRNTRLGRQAIDAAMKGRQ